MEDLLQRISIEEEMAEVEQLAATRLQELHQHQDTYLRGIVAMVSLLTFV